MDIACCTDRIYLKYCLTMLLSFFDHHREEDVYVHLLANGLLKEDIKKVRDLVEENNAGFEVYEVDGEFLSSLTSGQYSYRQLVHFRSCQNEDHIGWGLFQGL